MLKIRFCVRERSVPILRLARLSACYACVAAAVFLTQTAAGQSAPSSTAPPPVVYVKAGHLFDATSDNFRDNVILVIEGEPISKVLPAAEASIPAGAKVVDLSQAWVLPGLIDCHTHLSYRADQYDPINDVKLTPFDFV